MFCLQTAINSGHALTVFEKKTLASLLKNLLEYYHSRHISVWNIASEHSNLLWAISEKMRGMDNLRVFHNSRRYNSMFHVNKAVKVPILGTSPQVLSFMNLFFEPRRSKLNMPGPQSTEIKWTIPLLPVPACSFLFLQGMDSDGTSF